MAEPSNKKFATSQHATINLREICGSCNKPRIASQSTSLSDWIFGAPDVHAVVDRWGCTCDSIDAQKKSWPGIETNKQSNSLNLLDQSDSAREQLDPLIKSVVQHWRIVSLKSSGYLGNVYEAVDTTGSGKVFIRIFNNALSQNPRIAKRFLLEAEKTSKLTHSNIGMVYQSGRLPDGSVYVVSEFLEGVTLSRKLETEGFFSPEEALVVLIEICEALKEAHQHDVLHRALKPENVVIEKDKVKVVDFGLEKAIPPAGKTTQHLSRMTGELSDPRYMSPEQCLGSSLDERSDIYSMGCLMYEVLTGVKIFKKLNGINLALAQLNAQPESFKSVMYNSDIPPMLEKVVFQCLEKAPEDRYQKIEHLQADLEALRNEKTPTHLITPAEKKTSRGFKPPADRTRQFIVAAICMAVLITGLIIGRLLSDLSSSTILVDEAPQVVTERPEEPVPDSSYKEIRKKFVPKVVVENVQPPESNEEPPIPSDEGNTKLSEAQVADAMLGNWHYQWNDKSGDMLITNTWGRRFAGFITTGKKVLGVSGRVSVIDDRIFLIQSDGQSIYNSSNLRKDHGKWKIVNPSKSAAWKGFESQKSGSVTSRLMNYKPKIGQLDALAGEWMPLSKDNPTIKSSFNVSQVSDKGVFKITRPNGKRGYIVIDDQKRVIFEHNFEWQQFTLKDFDGLPCFDNEYALAQPKEKFEALQASLPKASESVALDDKPYDLTQTIVNQHKMVPVQKHELLMKRFGSGSRHHSFGKKKFE